ncbi:hypothetical protein A8F17_38560, partial [Burkholderia cenocepacia]
SSSMIGLAISSVSVVPMPEVNSSPRKLTAPPGLFETVSYYARLLGMFPSLKARSSSSVKARGSPQPASLKARGDSQSSLGYPQR